MPNFDWFSLIENFHFVQIWAPKLESSSNSNQSFRDHFRKLIGREESQEIKFKNTI